MAKARYLLLVPPCLTEQVSEKCVIDLYVRCEQVLAIILTDFDGWVILFDSGLRIKNANPDYAKKLIEKLNALT
jgi:hypothetical protein